MPLDNSLDQHKQLILWLYCSVILYFPNDNPRKFVIYPPNTISDDIKRIWVIAEGAPIPYQIYKDDVQALASLGVIYQAGYSIMVPQLSNRNGYCNYATGKNITGSGELLVMKLVRWLYPDAVCVKSEQTAAIVAKREESDHNSPS